MDKLTVDNGLALKEWAAITVALEQGVQVIVLRKGGIHENTFYMTAPNFFMYPTGYHQQSSKVKPKYSDLVNIASGEDFKAPDGKVRIRCFGVTDKMIELKLSDNVLKLSAEYVYTDDEMKSRYDFRPGTSLTCLILRIYRLPVPVDISVLGTYGGCVSWINIEEHIDTDNSIPVLDTQSYKKRMESVLKLLA